MIFAVHQFNITADNKEETWEAFNLEPPDFRFVKFNLQTDLYNIHAFNMLLFRFCVFSLRFSESGEEILAGASDRCLYVYNREEKRNMLKVIIFYILI